MLFKSGFAAIIGRPNVGKSTLINALSGEKIVITSHKPQTTRNVIKAIINKEDCQIILLDTPGIHIPKNKLGKYMVSIAEDSFKNVDVVLYMVEAIDKEPKAGDLHIISQLKAIKTPVFLLINKIDLVSKDKLLPLISTYKDLMDFKAIIPISAIENNGSDIVIDKIKDILEEGPKYFPDDIITDQPEKQIVAEVIREKILRLIEDEIPHGVGVEIISFKDNEKKQLITIGANIYCEKDSHKGIIIGKEGKMLKKIGMYARQDIENILARKVFLELWVKVKPDWRNSDNILKTLGYKN